jgi:mycofactocin system creatininase family protein
MTASLADLTWPEADVGRSAGALLVVPIGATEQHGPHLPLSTDTDIAIALARRVAAQMPDVVVAPAVAYGASGEHEGFAGTLSIGPEAVELVLLELGRSACATFQRLVFVSAHGGNAEPVARATGRLRDEGRAVLAWSPRFDGDAHAGRVETSLMLALHPDRVHRHHAVTGNAAPLRDLWPALRADGVRAVSASGVLGDPAGASAVEGRRLLDAAADELVATVRDWVGSG